MSNPIPISPPEWPSSARAATAQRQCRIFYAILSLVCLLQVAGAANEDSGAAGKFDFVPMFNGTDLSGWQTFDGKVPTNMVVRGDAVVAVEEGVNLYSAEEYDDYILQFEFQMPAEGDCGIGIRAPIDDRSYGNRADDPAFTSVEIQMLDMHSPEYQKLDLFRCHGAVYGLVPVTEKPELRPRGQWNEQEIRTRGSRVTVTVNGKTILDGNIAAAPAHRSNQGGPGMGAVRAEGHIAIMKPTVGVAFRNMQIRRLRPATTVPVGPMNVAPVGYFDAFNGQDLTGWRAELKAPYDNPRARKGLDADFIKQMIDSAGGRRSNWEVKDGILICTGPGRGIVCDAVVTNFELHLDYSVAPGCDSGLLLRETPQIQIWDADAADLARYGADKGSGAMWFAERPEDRFPLVRADRPAGKWNHLFVRMVRNRVSVWLNDKLVLNGAVLTDYWNPGKASVVESGPIGIVASHQRCEFRNIYLKAL